MITSVTRTSAARRLAAGLAATVLIVACGDDDGESQDTAGATDPAAATVDEPEAADLDEPTASDGADADEGADESAGVLEYRPVAVTGDPLPPYDSTVPDDALGTPAPVIAGASFDGTPVTLGGPTDGPTMIVFLAHWCPHCNDEIPEIVSLNDAGSLPTDLDVIGVTTASDPSADNFPPSEWIVAKEWPFPTLADDEANTAMATMGGTAFPYTVVLDGDGNVLARRAGSASADEILAFVTDAIA